MQPVCIQAVRHSSGHGRSAASGGLPLCSALWGLCTANSLLGKCARRMQVVVVTIEDSLGCISIDSDIQIILYNFDSICSNKTCMFFKKLLYLKTSPWTLDPCTVSIIIRHHDCSEMEEGSSCYGADFRGTHIWTCSQLNSWASIQWRGWGPLNRGRGGAPICTRRGHLIEGGCLFEEIRCQFCG